MLHRHQFAKNLVTAPFFGVFSYATQVKVCKKLVTVCSIFESFSYDTL